MHSNLFDEMLRSKLVEDNEYFNEYKQLICNNIETPSIKFKTQQHHIIPVHFTKYYNFSDVNPDIRVNLTFKDHILAHYYLTLCGTSDDIRYANELAVLRMIGDSTVSLEDRCWIESLEHYSEIYEESCRINSAKHKGKLPWNAGKHYTVGPMSDIRKQRISKKAEGRYVGDIWIHHGTENKHVKPDQLDTYLEQGFELGRNDPECNRKNSESQRRNPNRAMLGKHQSEYQKTTVSAKLKGVPKTAESRNNMKLAKSGKILISNDTTQHSFYVDKNELNKYINEGYRKGRLNKRP